ncbi:MAG: hypothetical protein AAGA58_18390 [Verrucomicrobiota bacterium]
MTRLFTGALLGACLIGLFSATAETAPTKSLFVLTASRGDTENGVLKLNLLHPEIIYFSDRPERVGGKMSAKEFFKSWTERTDSFADDPPNASLSLAGDDGNPCIMELMSGRLSGQTATFQYKVLAGQPPASFGRAFLFIDGKVIGINL